MFDFSKINIYTRLIIGYLAFLNSEPNLRPLNISRLLLQMDTKSTINRTQNLNGNNQFSKKTAIQFDLHYFSGIFGYLASSVGAHGHDKWLRHLVLNNPQS